jgi:hypothetical protein
MFRQGQIEKTSFIVSVQQTTLGHSRKKGSSHTFFLTNVSNDIVNTLHDIARCDGDFAIHDKNHDTRIFQRVENSGMPIDSFAIGTVNFFQETLSSVGTTQPSSPPRCIGIVIVSITGHGPS